jgi:ELWxxDGT repeat protein
VTTVSSNYTYSEILQVNGDLYFAGKVGSDASELWRYDPDTSTAEPVVQTIGPQTYHAISPSEFAVWDGKLYLYAWYGFGTTTERSLVVCDPGTGLHQIAATNLSYPTEFTLVQDDIYFTAYRSDLGEALWKCEVGTGAISMVADPDPGTITGGISNLFTYQGYLYFAAEDGISGNELRRYDPNTGIVEMVLDFHPGYDDSNPGGSVVFSSGDLYFEAHDGLDYCIWKL